jgi:hypothetical protein
MTHPDYSRDLAEIRSMMERSSKFMSLSGLSGVLAGIYALSGVMVAWYGFGFNPAEVATYTSGGNFPAEVLYTALVVLVLAIATAIVLAMRNARRRSESVWNSASRQMLTAMAIPLGAGGVFILAMFVHGAPILALPLSLIFYGIALFSAARYTYRDVYYLGLLQILLGMLAAFMLQHSLVLWATGFGVLHIAYGLHMHLRYER